MVHTDTMHVVHARAAGLDVHKMQIAATARLARICQFGLCSASLVPPARFRALRKVSRPRRQVVRERARIRNRVHKILDAAGARVGGASSPTCSAPTDCASLRGWTAAWTPKTSLTACPTTCAPTSARCATRSRPN
ncbi:MAG: hypothetical protein OXQ89_16600 [Rhodospirillaceae bacterium]|nr:hypothetical protein [Rhodospirillaceae bacterium]MDE0362404.1 hypothetical protein [Rhodospirillaceae bacterium]